MTHVRNWVIACIIIFCVGLWIGDQYRIHQDNHSLSASLSLNNLSGVKTLSGLSANSFTIGPLRVVNGSVDVDVKDKLASFAGVVENHSHKTVTITSVAVFSNQAVLFYEADPIVIAPMSGAPLVAMSTDSFDPYKSDITGDQFALQFTVQ